MTSVPSRAVVPAPLFLPLSDGRVLTCTLRRSVRARRLRLTVSAAGELVLVVPQRQRLTAAQAQDILDAHAAWISRAVSRAGKRAAVAPPPLELPERITLPAVGTERLVELRSASKTVPGEDAGSPRVSGTPGHIAAVSGAPGDAVQAERVLVRDDGARLLLSGATENTALCCAALQRWLAGQARPLLTALVDEMSAHMGLAVAGVQIRGQRTRWGSCSYRRVLSLNYRLVLLPESQIRYLILHELCHLKHMDHSPAYRDFLAGYEPRWKERERELLQAWRALPRWCR